MHKMEYRKLGNTDLQVSVLCLGTMTFGEQNTLADGCAQLDLARELGVNFLDTAEMYAVPPKAETYGATESIIGKWLQQRGKRDDVVVATKVVGPSGHPQPNSPPPFSWIRDGKTRHNKKYITAAVDGSLKRLQTDYIDLYQLHWPDRNTNFFGSPNYVHRAQEEATPILETLHALESLLRAGKIRHIGLSNETPWGISQFLHLADQHSLPRVVSVQNPYHLLNRTYEIGAAEISAREQCGLLPYSPLAFGVLTGKYRGGARPPKSRLALFPIFSRYLTDKADDAVEAYYQLAQKHGVSLTQMALAWTVQQPFITSSIIGATTLAQLRENIAAADFAISDELRGEIEEISKTHFNPCP